MKTELNELFDYDGALADLREMYERGRRWVAQYIADPATKSPEFMGIYQHTLELAFVMMAFRERAEGIEQF